MRLKINKENTYITIYSIMVIISLVVALSLKVDIVSMIIRYVSNLNFDFNISCKCIMEGYDESLQFPYPPLANLFYKLSALFLNYNAVGFPISLKYHIFAICFHLLPVVFTVLLLLFFYHKKNIRIPLITIPCMALSAPFFTALRVSNMSIWGMVFSLAFFVFYETGERKLKELAIASLAISTSIRIMPAVFSLYILLNKEYKLFIKYIIYVILLSLVPLLFLYDSIHFIDRIKLVVSSVISYNNAYAPNRVGGLKIFSHITHQICKISGVKFDVVMVVSFFSKFLSCFLVILSFKMKNNEKDLILLLCCIQILFSVATYHSCSLFLIPLAYEFMDNRFYNKIGFLQFVLLCLIQTITIAVFCVGIPKDQLWIKIHSIFIDIMLNLEIMLIVYKCFNGNKVSSETNG